MNTLNKNANENNLSMSQKPIYALTVDEFSLLLSKLIQKEMRNLPDVESSIPKNKDRDIISLEEAMDITGYKKPTIYSKVSRYEIPVVSRCKPLKFSKKELITWMRNGKPNMLEMDTQMYLDQIEKK